MSDPDDFDIFDNVQYDTFYDELPGMWEPADFLGGESSYTPSAEEIAWERACASGTNPDERTLIYDNLVWEKFSIKIQPSNWEPQKKLSWYNRLIGR